MGETSELSELSELVEKKVPRLALLKFDIITECDLTTVGQWRRREH